ncbi:MAG: hypothetical protein MJ000_11180 [Bacteroidales bacterium]|nr:hypothetical protein [Bacteroidales bacterium]
MFQPFWSADAIPYFPHKSRGRILSPLSAALKTYSGGTFSTLKSIFPAVVFSLNVNAPVSSQ